MTVEQGASSSVGSGLASQQSGVASVIGCNLKGKLTRKLTVSSITRGL